MANSSSRLPAKTVWVCESTNPGITTQSRQSRTSDSPRLLIVRSSIRPIQLNSSFSISTAAFSMQPRDPISFPALKRRPSEETVTSCFILMSASFMLQVDANHHPPFHPGCFDFLENRDRGGVELPA